MKIAARPALVSDMDFARATHHQAYREVVQRQFGPWDEQAQDRFFADDWASGDFEILSCNDILCGYCCIELRKEDIFVRELVVLPQFQGQGIGSEVLRRAIRAAKQDGLPVRLGTCHTNRAIVLYRRLGFKEIGRTDTHLLMECRQTKPTIFTRFEQTIMSDRHAHLERKTSETQITLDVNLDGDGASEIVTGVGFFDHMLTHVARHGLLHLTIQAAGDLHIDDHHTVEDVGIALGQALREAVGDKVGIARYGYSLLPMDEALVTCALDWSGRGLLVDDFTFPAPKIGTFDTELVPEFFRAVAANAGLTLHFEQHRGRNAHHIAEASFKAFGRALDMAKQRDTRVGGIPSTKGIL